MTGQRRAARRGFQLLALMVLLAGFPETPTVLASDAADPRHVSDTLELVGDFAMLDGPAAALPLTRTELAALPGYVEISARLVPHEPDVTLGVLPLSALLTAFPLAPHADGLVLETLNRWESFLTVEHLREHDSQLLLYYAGEAPSSGSWPAWGGDVEPLAPFYVFDADQPIPSFPGSPAFGMIAATQITRIRATSVEHRYGAILKLELSEVARAGRRLFLQRCNTCHRGLGGAGGNSSARPFAVLTALATYNPDYFRRLVADPKQVYPETSMPAHPDFADEEFAALIAFLSEAKR
ncbi:MAG: cytochrome c [Pseudomonadota bacterium]